MTRPESVLAQPVTTPASFRHPFYMSARDEQADARRDEIAALIRRDDEFRARLARARVLEAVH